MTIFVATENFFFSIFDFFFFWLAKMLIILPKKENKDNKREEFTAARVATILATRWTGNKLSLRVALAWLDMLTDKLSQLLLLKNVIFHAY